MNSINDQSMDIDTFSKLLDGISEISHNGRNLEGIFNDSVVPQIIRALLWVHKSYIFNDAFAIIKTTETSSWKDRV